jgi:hypothetical protein
VDIDVVVANGHGTDDAQFPRALENSSVNVVREEAKEAVCFGCPCDEFFSWRRYFLPPEINLGMLS